jgi:hypothetical protein
MQGIVDPTAADQQSSRADRQGPCRLDGGPRRDGHVHRDRGLVLDQAELAAGVHRSGARVRHGMGRDPARPRHRPTPRRSHRRLGTESWWRALFFTDHPCRALLPAHCQANVSSALSIRSRFVSLPWCPESLRATSSASGQSRASSHAPGRRADARWCYSSCPWPDRSRAGYSCRAPDAGPPWTTTAGLPSGFPQTSQYTRFPAPTSSIPRSQTTHPPYGSAAG